MDCVSHRVGTPSSVQHLERVQGKTGWCILSHDNCTLWAILPQIEKA